MVEDKEELRFIIPTYFLIGTEDPYKNKSSKYSHSNKWWDQFNWGLEERTRLVEASVIGHDPKEDYKLCQSKDHVGAG